MSSVVISNLRPNGEKVILSDRKEDSVEEENGETEDGEVNDEEETSFEETENTEQTDRRSRQDKNFNRRKKYLCVLTEQDIPRGFSFEVNEEHMRQQLYIENLKQKLKNSSVAQDLLCKENTVLHKTIQRYKTQLCFVGEKLGFLGKSIVVWTNSLLHKSINLKRLLGYFRKRRY